MPNTNISINSGEVRKIIDSSDSEGDYDLRVEGGILNLGITKEKAYQGNRQLQKGRPATLTKNKDLETVYAYAPDTDVTLHISKTDFSLFRLPPMTLQGQAQNRDNLTAFTQSIGTSATQLQSNPVPDGFDVLVQTDSGNGSDVFVGNSSTQSVELQPGSSIPMGVSNTDVIYARASSGTQTIRVLVEA